MGEDLLPGGGCGRMVVEVVQEECRGEEVGMKAEMIPDGLLTGNIWQMIGGLVTGGGDMVGGAGGVVCEQSKDGCEEVGCCCCCCVCPMGGVLTASVFDMWCWHSPGLTGHLSGLGTEGM